MRLPHPSSDDPVELADWLEATLFLSGRKYASRSWIRVELQNTVFPETGSGADDLDPGPLDEALDNLFIEVARRHAAVPHGYPFRHAVAPASGIELVPGNTHLLYSFLLFLSVSPRVRTASHYCKVDRPFDEVVLAALCQYLGPRSRGVRFGTPASQPRPRQFSAAIGWLCAELDVPRGPGSARGHTGDGGVDVAVWLPFPFRDKLHTFIAVFAQCTIQANWYRKGRDIQSGQWRGWIDFGMMPAICLAVPFAAHVGDPIWDESRRDINLFLDRLRIVELARSLPTELRETLEDWTKGEILALAEAS